MFRFFYFLICLVFFSTSLSGQEKQFHILIKTQTDKGSFAKVEFGNTTFLADKDGACNIELDCLHLSDTITASLLGYKDYTFSINKELLQQKSIVINMVPQTYSLEEVTVKAKQILPVFRKVLNRSQRYKFNRKPRGLRFTYKKNNQLLLKGKTQYTLKLFKGVEIIDTSVFASHLILKEVTKKMVRVVRTIAGIVLIRGHLYKTYYQGKRDSSTYWKLKVLNKKKKRLKISPSDEFTGVIQLNSNGFIQNINVQMITNNETSSSYVLKTKYSLRDDNIYPQITKGELIVKNKSNGKFEKLEFHFEYLD